MAVLYLRNTFWSWKYSN